MWQSFAAIGLGASEMWLPKKTYAVKQKPVRNYRSGRSKNDFGPLLFYSTQNDKKLSKSSPHLFFFQAQKAPKSVFGRGSAPDPAGGAYGAPPDLLVGWRGGYPLPIPLPARRLRRPELGAYGASVLRPPQHKILATPVRTGHPVDLVCMLAKLGLSVITRQFKTPQR